MLKGLALFAVGFALALGLSSIVVCWLAWMIAVAPALIGEVQAASRWTKRSAPGRVLTYYLLGATAAIYIMLVQGVQYH